MTTWSAADKHANVTLSSGGVAAEVTGSSTDWKGVKSTPAISGRRTYLEITINDALIPEIVLAVGPISDTPTSDYGKLYKPAIISSTGSGLTYVNTTEGWEESGRGFRVGNTDTIAWASKGASYITSGQGSANEKLYPIWNNGDTLTVKHPSFTSNAFLLAIRAASPISGFVSAFGTIEPGWGDTYKAGDIIGIALDPVRGWAWFAKNGVWLKGGNPTTMSSPAISTLGENSSLSVFAYMRTLGNKITANFGASAFAYSAPAGFVGAEDLNMNFKVEGVVTKLGNPEDRTVMLFDRNLDQLYAKTVSDDVSGEYSFPAVHGDKKYLIVAVPNDEEVNTNSQCIDHAVPIPI